MDRDDVIELPNGVLVINEPDENAEEQQQARERFKRTIEARLAATNLPPMIVVCSCLEGLKDG